MCCSVRYDSPFHFPFPNQRWRQRAEPSVSLQSDPEFVQWKKELTEAFTEAQKLLRRAPKVIGKGRAGVVELSKPPLTHRNSNGL